jgi:hypothetical protein
MNLTEKVVDLQRALQTIVTDLENKRVANELALQKIVEPYLGKEVQPPWGRKHYLASVKVSLIYNEGAYDVVYYALLAPTKKQVKNFLIKKNEGKTFVVCKLEDVRLDYYKP